MSFVNVALPLPLSQVFTYRVPTGLAVEPGCRVVVPFGRKQQVGLVVSRLETPPEFRIKELSEVLDPAPIVSPSLLHFLKWIGDYYMAPIGEVCRTALPPSFLKLGSAVPRGPRQASMLQHSLEHTGAAIHLTTEQQRIVDAILPQLGKQFATYLLHGITGSGKTEIYLGLFGEVCRQKGQAIFLVPEIGLTPQLTGRVAARFPGEVAIYHSALTDAQRLAEWRRIRCGEARIIVGTRSALFAPTPNLQLIVVDEEHDASYKQEESPRYHARNCAIMRAKLEKIPIVLGSATPSLESYFHATQKHYHYFHLTERTGTACLPTIELIDMRDKLHIPTGGSHYLSPRLLTAIEKTWSAGKQSLLFLNRRGFASFMICSGCGLSPMCPNCSITLTLHRAPDRLLCHYCDYTIPVPTLCPSCQGPKLKPLGIGTQKLEMELRDHLPNARIARLDRDSAGSHRHRLQVLDDMKHGKLDILIGTQMVTKGHDFSNVVLVGIILADTSLHLPDFRAAERTFQLLTQTAGRAGRGDYPGHVLIQTFNPDHESLQRSARNDFAGFAAHELQGRRELSYPPFARLTSVRISGKEEEGVIAVAERVAEFLRAPAAACGIHLLGPAPAPITKLRGKFRWQMLLKSKGHAELNALLQRLQAYAQEKIPSSIQLTLDADPVNMM